MNKNIKDPFIVNFMAPSNDRSVMRDNRRVYIPTNVVWTEFQNAMSPIRGDTCDSVIVHIDHGLNLNIKGEIKGIDIKLKEITKVASEYHKPVLDKHGDIWYLLNPSWDDQKASNGYAPSDEVVMNRFKAFDGELSWQKHQSEIWARMADMMPLAEGEYYGAPNHIAKLTSEDRGLEKNDLNEFWYWKSNKVLTPSLTGDDMIGMPSIEGHDYDGFTITPMIGTQQGTEVPIHVRSIKTVGMSGIAIPMANVQKNVCKYQIATDISKINVMLKARAKDGISIQKSEYFDKKTNVFLFNIDGQKSNLKVIHALPDGKDNITFQDIKGTFKVNMKEDIKDRLIKRGYDIHPFIHSLTVVPNAKYIWQSKGTMVGSEDISKIVSPSNAGFTLAREPKNGKDDYVVLIVEGALKGRIVAKYADVKDKDGQSFGDYIAKDSGIIVAQVPGVAEAFVESVKPFYDHYNIKGTYISMDADGRENLSVARGIHTAYKSLSEKIHTAYKKDMDKSPVKVMSWDPNQKGLDDALLAIAHEKITMKDMDIRFGSPEKLFPLSMAKAPNPYRLDGTRANRQEWQSEFTKDSREKNEQIKAIQEETKKRAQDLMSNGKDLADNLPEYIEKRELQPQ